MSMIRNQRFYLTDEECKLQHNESPNYISASGFYLTDEECKYGHNLATGNINLCFYLTDEECKLV